MADADPPATLPGVVTQTPKAPHEVTWVEQAHGAESVMTIVALVIGAVWAVFGDWRKNRKERDKDRELLGREQDQRDKQLRWDQAKLAKEINDQFLDDNGAQQALTIVDADGDTCELSDEGNPPIKYTFDRTKDKRTHVAALRVDTKVTDKKEVFLRECFDAWFYWMAIMEQYLKNDLILLEDIAYPSDYYLRELEKEDDLFKACCKYIEYYQLSPNIAALMKRFADARVVKVRMHAHAAKAATA
jgi:hypothetical protein